MPFVDVLSTLPPDEELRARRRIAARRAELARLHGLSDRWLGEAVLRLARDVRSKVPGMATQPPDRRTVNGHVLWEVVPELARRLGCAVEPSEARGGIRAASAWDLRMLAGSSLSGLERAYLREAERRDADLCPVALLTHDVANGNPVAIMLDRVAPPTPSSDDRCATYVAEISTMRGLAPRKAWDPSMQVYGRFAASEACGPGATSPSPR